MRVENHEDGIHDLNTGAKGFHVPTGREAFPISAPSDAFNRRNQLGIAAGGVQPRSDGVLKSILPPP